MLVAQARFADIIKKIMEPAQVASDRIFSRKNKQYFLAALAAGIPIFITIHFFAHDYNQHDDEKVAFFITLYFLCGVFVGRYLSQLWTVKYKSIPNSVFRLLGIVILVCLVFVFLGAQFYLSVSRAFLGLLFFGLPLLLLSIAVGMIIKLTRTTLKNQLEEAKATAAQSQEELKFLQTQLSPHFLFNTLNNIYGISLSQHEKVPGLLLKLSSLLRYSVYDVKELFVPLKSELAYINDYIEFEKIRIGNKLMLTTAFEELGEQDINIAPLLLIVFIENAFKHSKNSAEQKIYINITLRTWGNSILFSVRNSCSRVVAEKSILDSGSGFGLVNVTKRLELLYNGQHSLEIENKDGYYSVMLQLKAK